MSHPHSLYSPWAPCPEASQRLADYGPAPLACPKCGHGLEILSIEAPCLAPRAHWPWAYGCTECNATAPMLPFTNYMDGDLLPYAVYEARSRFRIALKAVYLTGLSRYSVIHAAVMRMVVENEETPSERETGVETLSLTNLVFGIALLENYYKFKLAQRIKTIIDPLSKPPTEVAEDNSASKIRLDQWPSEDMRVIRELRSTFLDYPMESSCNITHFISNLPDHLCPLGRAMIDAGLEILDDENEGSYQAEHLESLIAVFVDVAYRDRVRELEVLYSPFLPCLPARESV